MTYIARTEEEIAKDFYLSAYTHPLTLEIIQKNDAERAKLVFGEYCPNWEHHRYVEAEILVSGIEYTTMMTAGESVSVDIRIAGALNTILATYNVPEETRRLKIEKVLAIDYRELLKNGKILQIWMRQELGRWKRAFPMALLPPLPITREQLPGVYDNKECTDESFIAPESAKVSVGYLPLTEKTIAMVVHNNLDDAAVSCIAAKKILDTGADKHHAWQKETPFSESCIWVKSINDSTF